MCRRSVRGARPADGVTRLVAPELPAIDMKAARDSTVIRTQSFDRGHGHPRDLELPATIVGDGTETFARSELRTHGAVRQILSRHLPDDVDVLMCLR